MCTYPVQPVCTSCTSLFILIFIKSTVDCIAHFISLHILLLILFYFIFYLFFILFLPIFIYTLLCYVSSFILFFLHCPLSGPVLTYISLLIIPCMIVYVTNKQEPWTLNLEPRSWMDFQLLLFIYYSVNYSFMKPRNTILPMTVNKFLYFTL